MACNNTRFAALVARKGFEPERKGVHQTPSTVDGQHRREDLVGFEPMRSSDDA